MYLNLLIGMQAFFYNNIRDSDLYNFHYYLAWLKVW